MAPVGEPVAAGNLNVVILNTNEEIFTDPGPGQEPVDIPTEYPPMFPEREVVLLAGAIA